MIKNFSHVAIEISNLEKALKFYCEALGLEYVSDSKNEEGKVVVVYLKIRGGVSIELFATGLHMPDRKDWLIGYHHMCFEVDDIHEIEQKILSKCGKITKSAFTSGNGNWQLWATDPDGNPVEFMQLSESLVYKK